jgi:hypothetical protein
MPIKTEYIKRSLSYAIESGKSQKSGCKFDQDSYFQKAREFKNIFHKILFIIQSIISSNPSLSDREDANEKLAYHYPQNYTKD